MDSLLTIAFGRTYAITLYPHVEFITVTYDTLDKIYGNEFGLSISLGYLLILVRDVLPIIFCQYWPFLVYLFAARFPRFECKYLHPIRRILFNDIFVGRVLLALCRHRPQSRDCTNTWHAHVLTSHIYIYIILRLSNACKMCNSVF
mgnify:CR=1 FL=1